MVHASGLNVAFSLTCLICGHLLGAWSTARCMQHHEQIIKTFQLPTLKSIFCIATFFNQNCIFLLKIINDFAMSVCLLTSQQKQILSWCPVLAQLQKMFV